jgi:NADPH2:quinone reductase
LRWQATVSIRTPEERDEAIAVLGCLFSEGKIAMPIDQVVPFAEVPDALERLGGGVNGKLISRVGVQDGMKRNLGLL